MARGLVYEEAGDVRELARRIVDALNDELGYILLDRIYFIRSRGSRSRALARIHALDSAWRYVLGTGPLYIIEVLSENYDGLTCREKTRVIIHELLHIPRGFTGGLRPHGIYVNSRAVTRLERILVRRLGGYPC